MLTPERHSDPHWHWATSQSESELGFPHWLLDAASLTDRLIALSKGEFRVEQLGQDSQLPRPSESELLELEPQQPALIREVQLMCHNQPWVFARSVIPWSTCSGSLAFLESLENRSLGSILFSDPSLIRSQFQLALIGGDNAYLPEHLQHDSASWGRRSVFEIQAKRIMVSEVFLPQFRAWPVAETVELDA